MPAKCHPAFVLFLILLALPAAAVASTPLPYSAARQCSPFSVTWAEVTSPSSLFILPFDAQPVISNLTNPLYDPVARTWHYTLDKLPLRSGTQFIVTLDYGNASPPTGDVSLIQTVGDSPDSSCLTSDALPMSSFFTLSPAVPSECSLQVVSWNTTRYQEPPFIRGFIPGGQTFNLGYPYPENFKDENWIVNIREGTQVVLLVQPSPTSQGNGDLRTSPLMTVTSKSSNDRDCLSIYEYKSTTILASTTATSITPTSFLIASFSTLPAAAEPSKKVNIPAIIGGVIGGLGLIAIVFIAIVLSRRRRRKNEMSPFKNSCTPMAPPRAFPHVASTRKRPLDAPKERPSLSNRPPGEPRIAHNPLPIVPSTGIASSNRREDPNTPPGVSPGDEKQADSVDILVQPRPDLTFIGSTSSASASAARYDSARRPHGSVTRPSVGARDEEGGEVVRGRSERNRSRPNVTETQYFRQTGAGTVRVVELPPSYNELQFGN